MKHNKPVQGSDQNMAETSVSEDRAVPPKQPAAGVEIGGRKGPDPTRYGDWEKNGRCIDF